MVSVIIATKNGERFIGRAIRSVLRQEGVELEVIVVDDASTDGTVGVVRALAASDARVRLVQREKNEGPGKARNFAVAHSKGEYIAVIDDDDEWPDTNKLAEQVKFLDTHPDHVLVGAAWVDIVDEEGKKLFEQRYPKTDAEIRSGLLARNYFTHSGAMYRKSSFDRINGYKDMRMAEDHDLWLRIGSLGKVANIDTFHISWTSRKTSSSAKKKWEMNMAALQLAWTYRKRYPHVTGALIRSVVRLVWYGIFGLASPYALIKKASIFRRS